MQGLILQASSLFAVVFAAVFWFMADPGEQQQPVETAVKTQEAGDGAVSAEALREEIRNAYFDLGNLDELADLAALQGRIGRWKIKEDNSKRRNALRQTILKRAINLDKNRCSASHRNKLLKAHRKYLTTRQKDYNSNDIKRSDFWKTEDDKLIHGLMAGLATNRYLVRKDFPGAFVWFYEYLLMPNEEMVRELRVSGHKWNAKRQTCDV